MAGFFVFWLEREMDVGSAWADSQANHIALEKAKKLAIGVETGEHYTIFYDNINKHVHLYYGKEFELSIAGKDLIANSCQLPLPDIDHIGMYPRI
ncbi:hypothetical protein GA0116948_107189 [Chitinophaga costaii]|uniref:Uncharacterized protein n=1 Tax=Chitinophaga costaii TaxID=1335309 RepID=A0A1C4E9E7_9BACT|nr:hypothetical protein [Chitinophaga costaii]SCC40273.1 hypothetical protein GA0116948_107189 [Chitinophaga costaii]